MLKWTNNTEIEFSMILDRACVEILFAQVKTKICNSLWILIPFLLVWEALPYIHSFTKDLIYHFNEIIMWIFIITISPKNMAYMQMFGITCNIRRFWKHNLCFLCMYTKLRFQIFLLHNKEWWWNGTLELWFYNRKDYIVYYLL